MRSVAADRRLRRIVPAATTIVALAIGSVGVLGPSCGDAGAPTTADEPPALSPVILSTGLRPSTGRSYHVSPGGSDGSRGTARSRPWRTMTRGLRHLKPGQTLRLQGGVHAGPVVIERSGTARQPITVTGEPGRRAILTGRLKITGDYVRVRNLVFDGPAAAIYVSGADHVEISRNEIRNVAGSAIYVGDEEDVADDVTIWANDIHDNGTHWNLDHGVYFGHGRGGMVVNNVIDHNYAHGIKLGPNAKGILVANNTVVGNRRSGIMVGGDGKHTSEGNRIVSNIIANNAHMGIRTYWESTGIGAGNLAAGNVGFGHPAGDFVADFRGISYRDNVSADPRFVDARARKYMLRPDSPAIGAALGQYRLSDDFRGARRPRGTRTDAGAFESG